MRYVKREQEITSCVFYGSNASKMIEPDQKAVIMTSSMVGLTIRRERVVSGLRFRGVALMAKLMTAARFMVLIDHLSNSLSQLSAGK